jgi:hypothetical protein
MIVFKLKYWNRRIIIKSMKSKLFLVIILILLISNSNKLFSQSTIDSIPQIVLGKNKQEHNTWISFSPFTLIQVFTLYPWYYFEYGHYFNSKNALITALDFGKNLNSNSQGYYNFFSFLIGYRQHIWRSLHFQTEILSGYEANFNNENTFQSKGFNGLTLSFRIGYKFDFNLCRNPFLFNIQVQSIKDITKKSSFVFFPACQVGYRF